MRLLYFCQSLTAHDLRFITSLVGAGVEVKWLRLGAEAALASELPSTPLLQIIRWTGDTRDYRLEELPALVPELKEIIRSIRPNIFHAGPVQNCAYLAALTGFMPQVTLSYGYDLLMDAERSPTMYAATRAALDNTTALFVDCEAVRRQALAVGFVGRPVVQFPWGIDLQRFAPGDGTTVRHHLGWQDNFVFLSLRAMEPIYGVDVVVDGFLRAARKDSRLRLALLGTGSLEADLHRQVTASGIAERVYFGGRVANAVLPDWYRAADCYVSASHTDGSSVSLMEALACSVPVLVSDIPGNREWVEEGEQGWFFSDGDTAMLADLMLAAAAHPNLAALGTAARQRAQQKADWQINFQIMLNGYRQALRFSSPWTIA